MSESDVDRLFRAIEELRKDVQSMARHGCAKAPEHADHENRLRTIEAVIAKQSGAYAVIAVIASAGTAFLVWLGNIIIKRMGAGS